MFEPSKVVCVIAVILSALCIFVCLTTLPMLYEQINELHDDVMLEMEDFRVRKTEDYRNIFVNQQNSATCPN